MSVFARILLFTVVVSLAGCSSAEQAQAPGGGGMMQMPPVPASTSPAVEENVPVQVHAFGTVEAFASVDVKSQVAGPLLSVKFTEGTNVAKGDLLFEVDPRPFQEILRQAEATLTKDNAQLQLAEANLARDQANQKNVDVDAARYAQLAQEGIATRMQTEQLRTSADMAREAVRAGQAAIASIRASLDSDRAVIEKAKLDLSYCQIHAPISGRTGNLLVHAGNLLKVNDNALVVINQIAPIFVSFGVPERDFNAVASKSRGKKVAVHASFDDGTGSAEGSLSVIDNKIDSSTGTVRLKATFDNRSQTLWPGRFVNVVMTLDTQKATVIPSEAVQAGQQGPFVYVVKGDQSVEPRPVEVGATVAGKVVILKGVNAGEIVVTDGQSRLFPGAKVASGAQGK